MLLELNLLALTNIVFFTFIFLFQTNDHSHHGFLLHVESQARSKQEEERKIINQLEEEWAKKVAEDKEA